MQFSEFFDLFAVEIASASSFSSEDELVEEQLCYHYSLKLFQPLRYGRCLSILRSGGLKDSPITSLSRPRLRRGINVPLPGSYVPRNTQKQSIVNHPCTGDRLHESRITCFLIGRVVRRIRVYSSVRYPRVPWRRERDAERKREKQEGYLIEREGKGRKKERERAREEESDEEVRVC